MPEPILRHALPSEAPALARLHVAVWRETYRDLAPPEAYAALDEPRRRAQWENALAAPPPCRTLVLEEAGRLVGLVGLGPATDPVFGTAGEIRHLYVAADRRGAGLGMRLLGAGLAALCADGFGTAALAVVEANHAARAFYARAGGQEGPSFRDQGPLWRSENLVIRFELPTRLG